MTLFDIAERPEPVYKTPKKTRTASRLSGLEKLRREFMANRGRLYEIEELERIAGRGGWRTRCSNLRKCPYYMDVENVLEWRRREDGTSWCWSRYRYNGPLPADRTSGM